jgi:hypothetical protein
VISLWPYACPWRKKILKLIHARYRRESVLIDSFTKTTYIIRDVFHRKGVENNQKGVGNICWADKNTAQYLLSNWALGESQAGPPSEKAD